MESSCRRAIFLYGNQLKTARSAQLAKRGVQGAGSLAGAGQVPCRGSFSLEKRKTGAEPIAAIHYDYDIPGRNRPHIQFKFILPPDLRCSWLYSIGVPIKIDFRASA